MDVVELIPGLHFLRFPIGHAYLLDGPAGLALVDTSVPGSAPDIAAAIRGIGRDPADLRHLVLTHFHADHCGAAAEIAGWGDVEVLAHAADAPFLRGDRAGPLPDLASWERPLFHQVAGRLPAVPVRPVPVSRELRDGDEIGLGDSAVLVAAPGHTPGSAAVYLPASRVLISGDAIARRPDGQPVMGVFNAHPALAAASFRRLAALDTEIACFGHGEPITEDAGHRLRAAAGG